jgi:choline-sulfatase
MASLLNQMLDPEATDQRAKADQDALVARFGGREAALGKGPAGASPVPSR